MTSPNNSVSPLSSARQPSPAALNSPLKSPLNTRPSTGSLRSAPPPSPRQSTRHPSISHSMADLLSTPPLPKQENVVPRDWRTVSVGELVDNQVLRYVDLDTPVETACQMLIDHNLSSLPIRSSPSEESICGTFDYTDLNAFLLLIMGLYQPEEDEDLSSFEELAKKARAGGSIPVKLVKDLGKKGPFVTMPESTPLSRVVEVLGSGVHRIAVAKEGTDKVIGMISQLRLVRFFWDFGRCFSDIEQLYPQSLRELGIGSTSVISINGDKRVLDALEVMNSEGVSSLAVVDNHNNVVGNISTADVKHLTRSSSIPLLRSTCFHFLTVILTDRGLNDGKDSYPVFHVNPQSSLAHTVAKIVATQAHRMWITDAPSPSSTTPSTPSLGPSTTHPLPSSSPSIPTLLSTSPTPIVPPPNLSHMHSPMPHTPIIPGTRTSGRLSGVVSLTDILHLIAKTAGLQPEDPNEARKQRRRSSSCSMRTSFDMGRPSLEQLREFRAGGASGGGEREIRR
ncbi:hypothetical protein BZA77DRAFT_320473 [Pyronema omphalodes]|nr:hypothetical protein BZA77DRAFT_320473 [Pyronema omphalodes]